jgi:hypothetical protein
MRLILFFSFTFLTVNHFANAQIRATTESGNKVLLFDDGTWRYDESRAVGTSAAVVAPTTKDDFSIDSTRVFETNVEDLFFQSSPRLTKFFGVDGSNIRCKVSCSNTKGLLRLHFRWEFPDAQLAELVDALVSGTSDRKYVKVRVLYWALGTKGIRPSTINTGNTLH